MNTNRRNQLKFGNINVIKMITADQLKCKVSTQELDKMLHSFNYKEILIQLARINLFFQRSPDFLRAQKTLKSNFCSIPMLNKIRQGLVFSRQTTLRLLDICVCGSDLHATRTIDQNDAKADLVKAYLNVNGLLDTESSILPMQRDEEIKKLLVEIIPTMEYAINSSPAYETKKLIVRIEERLRRLLLESKQLDVNEIFSQVTGLKLRDYQRLVFGIFAFYWNFTPEEICRQGPTDKPLFFNPNGNSPALTPLLEKLLSHICISIDDLNDKAANLLEYKNEFLLWREYPLLRINENQIMCIDFSFLLEKLQTGIFWTIREYLKGKKEMGIFERLWGDVFEDYTASIIQRGVNSQNQSTRDELIIKPKYDQKKKQNECSDIAICNDDTLVLLECKASTLSAPAKFSGDFGTFYDNTKPAKKGVEQLWNAIRLLGNKSQTIKQEVKGIDTSKVKKIYPVLVLSDNIFSTLLMNWFWDKEFKSLKQENILIEHLKIMPLTILTISDIESLEPYLSDNPFHAHLNKWITQFQDDDKLSFNAYLHDLMQSDPRDTLFIDNEFERIWRDGQDYFFSY